MQQNDHFLKRSRSLENLSVIERGFRWLKAANDNLQEKRILKNRIKILITGLPLSGKSSLMNHLRIQTTSLFPEEMSQKATGVITGLILEMMDKLVQMLVTNNPESMMPHLTELLRSFQKDRVNCENLCALKPTIVQILLYPMAEEAINEYYFKFPQNFRYFLDALDRIAHKNYVPSHEDMLRAPIQSEEVEDAYIIIRKNAYALTILNGSRLLLSRRSIGYFADSSCFLFIAFLDRFDTDLQTSFDIFNEIAKLRFLKKSAFIVILNKSRDFQRKIDTFDFCDYFPEFKSCYCFEMDLTKRIERFVGASFARSLLPSQVHFTHVTDVVSTFTMTFFHNCIKSSVLSYNLANYYFV